MRFIDILNKPRVNIDYSYLTDDNEITLSEALKTLKTNNYILENRAVDIESIVSKYLDIFKLKIKDVLQDIITKTDAGIYTGSTITIEIPETDLKLIYSTKTIKMLPLTIKIYGETRKAVADYGQSMYSSLGGTEPDTVPAEIVLNLENITRLNRSIFICDEYLDLKERWHKSKSYILNKLISRFFGKELLFVLNHELTHYCQIHNEQIDGSDKVEDYDEIEMIRSGRYANDPREFEARLHSEIKKYIKYIKRFPTTVVAKELLEHFFNYKLNKADYEKYYSEILKFCQIIKDIPDITEDNFNSPEMVREMNKRL